jgi:hypothetical protein
VLTVVLVIGGAAALFGAQLARRRGDLSSSIPRHGSGQAADRGWVSRPTCFQTASEGSGISGMAGNIAMSLGSGFADALLILVGGIFLAAPRASTVSARSSWCRRIAGNNCGPRLKPAAPRCNCG